MKSVLAFFVSIFVVIGGVLSLLFGILFPQLPTTPAQDSVTSGRASTAPTAKRVITPTPIVATTESPNAALTASGVYQWTNIMRRDNGGFAPLALNAKLTTAAQAKLKDMFALQYFEHVSPSGIGPAGLADRVGYAYITIGENLALGNFENDHVLLDAWMASPEHRANILRPAFSEIGVAVGRGMYQGRMTWLAVQEFGKPISDCPSVDSQLKASITANESLVRQLSVQAQQLKSEIDATPRPRTQQEVDAYNAKVNAYNDLVDQIRVLNQRIQRDVATYNAQVDAFNGCANQ